MWLAPAARLRFLLFRQQRPDGSFPQNSDVTGKPALTNLQLDEVADPIILAWQLGAQRPGAPGSTSSGRPTSS